MTNLAPTPIGAAMASDHGLSRGATSVGGGGLVASPALWASILDTAARQREATGRVSDDVARLWLRTWLDEVVLGLEVEEDDDGLARRLVALGCAWPQARRVVLGRRVALMGAA